MKLKDIFEKPISGEWGKEVGEGEKGSKVIRTTNFTNIGRLDLSSIVERDIDSIKHENKKLKFGDIIIEKSGGSPTQPVGRVVIFEETNEEVYFCNNFTSILRPNKNIVPKFGLYLLKNLYNKKKVLKFQNKTTGIINIKLNDYLNNTEITIPNLEVQDRIVEVLNKTQELIDKRKEQIESLDELVKSKFIEMFGDPVINPKGWKYPKIEEVVANEKNAIKAGPFGSALKKEYYIKSGYKIYGQEQVISGDINLGDYYISEEKYKELENYAIKSNDVLISLVGTYGKLLIVPTIFEAGIINPRLMKITFNSNLINTIYFKFFFQSESLRNRLSDNTHGGTMPILNVGIVRNINIPIPPIELQNQFADFVKQVDKLKFEMENSLKKLEDNFNSLMQKSFNGELFN
ncbi:restriction endonuclease subunit S [Clostridium perfringens]|uniref:restriction endonuclease subunit S n=2 Tax=Clostridium perfringens TaxID=1502 RepID=UPI001BA66296|nr:restriction endonuclease subunit S [Clostridium perfringens]MDM0856821.1 restriction endonuclease subunit S [Clostridium perfringens]QUD72778.1 restriction endonuclease subunit S [Clostridium perfringens]HBI7044882.1 restriction endonuclease subunit S [Clostridium perfringens]